MGDVFRDIGNWIYERAGIEIPERLQEFDVFENPRGSVSCQGKPSYRGPIAPRSGGLQRIKLDLTLDELVVLQPTNRVIVHDYSDGPAEEISALCYPYQEVLAEKVRALCDRARPRDLYDVIHLDRNVASRPQSATLLDVLEQKCEHRGLAVPTLGQALPPVDTFWEVLPEFFAWLQTGVTPVEPARYQMAAGETRLRERTLRLPVSRRAQSCLNAVRFAAANRLCVDIKYQGTLRRVEPYALRRTPDGEIVLHATSASDGEHQRYCIDRLQGARSSGQNFVPRFAVEVGPNPLS